MPAGEHSYHGQEGYRTRHHDANRSVPLPTHQRPCGDLFGGEQDHPEYDPVHPAGYETASTGLMMVGAREYDPEIGRFLQPDPQPTGPELQWGQLNRWAYCANDPVNASDPSGEVFSVWTLAVIAVVFLIGAALGAYLAHRGLRFNTTGLLTALAALSAAGIAAGQCVVSKTRMAGTAADVLLGLLIFLLGPSWRVAGAGAAFLGLMAASFLSGLVVGNFIYQALAAREETTTGTRRLLRPGSTHDCADLRLASNALRQGATDACNPWPAIVADDTRYSARPTLPS